MFEGMRAPVSIEGFCLFGMPIPLYNGIAFADATSNFTEQSISATSMTEKTVSATSWSEASG